MKYLKEYNKYENNELVQQVNDVLLELNDLGFISYSNGRVEKKIELKPTHSNFDKYCYFGINRDEFSFDDIKDTIFRIKDIVGIDKIKTFNFIKKGWNEYYSLENNNELYKIENETLDIKGVLVGIFMIFDFPVNPQ